MPCTVYIYQRLQFFRQFSWPIGMRLSFLNYYPTQAPESTNNDEFHIFLLSVHPQNIQLFMSDNQGGEDVTQVLCSMQCISYFQPIPILFFELFYWLILTSHTNRPTLHDYVKCVIANNNCFIRLTTWCCWECHFRPPTWRYPRPPWY